MLLHTNASIERAGGNFFGYSVYFSDDEPASPQTGVKINRNMHLIYKFRKCYYKG